MRFFVSAFCGLLLAGMACAQAPAPPQPAPELKNVGYFVGTWKMDGDMKPGPMGPGGKMSMHEKCEWMSGQFFMVCHSDYTSVMGNGTGLSVMGYNVTDKTYTYDEYNSLGEAEHSKGVYEGDTWTWNGEEKMGGQTIKGRFTMKILTPTSYAFTYEMSQDGTNWMKVMDGKATKAQ